MIAFMAGVTVLLMRTANLMHLLTDWICGPVVAILLLSHQRMLSMSLLATVTVIAVLGSQGAWSTTSKMNTILLRQLRQRYLLFVACDDYVFSWACSDGMKPKIGGKQQ